MTRRGIRWPWPATAIVLLCVSYVVAAAAIRPSLMPDPAYGLLVHKSMRHGAPWNRMTEPRADDIARDHTYFYAVWSPGQYAVPGVLIDAGVSTGTAAQVVSVFCSIAGLAGWWWLFRALQWEPAIGLAACALIAASRSFNHSFLAYVGSDVLAFAVFPFLAVALLKLRDSVWLSPFAAVAMFAAFFAKNSLPIYVGAWLTAQSLAGIRERGAGLAVLMRAMAPLAVAAVAVLFIQWSYNSRGWNPIAYAPQASSELHKYALPWAMPLLSATSWDDILSRLFSHPLAPVAAFDYKRSLPVLAVTAMVSVIGAVSASWRNPAERFVLPLIFSVIVLAVFTVLLSTGSGASLDLSRHYRIVGYTWLPAIIGWVLTRRRGAMLALVAALLLPCAYGVASFAANWRRHLAHSGSHSARIQITHLDTSPRVVDMLTLLDRELPPQSLMVTSTPAHALELVRTRALATSAVSDSTETLQSNRRSGVVDNLVVITELQGMTDAKQRAWLQSFGSYHDWESTDLDTHRFHIPVGQVVSAAWLRSRIAQLSDDFD